MKQFGKQVLQESWHFLFYVNKSCKGGETMRVKVRSV